MAVSAGPLSGCRVLVVEDEYIIASDMERLLRRAGAEVVGPCPDVAQALAALNGTSPAPDAAILDITLGRGEKVYPVADRLAELGIPYLFASGSTPVVDNPGYRRRPLLQKPVSDRVLLKAVEALVREQKTAIPSSAA